MILGLSGAGAFMCILVVVRLQVESWFAAKRLDDIKTEISDDTNINRTE